MNIEFETIKEEIKNLKNLKMPNYEKPFILRTGVSNIWLGAILSQKDEFGKRKPIEWASRKLITAESK